MRTEIQQFISGLGLDDCVFMMGFLESPMKFVSFADYVVLPSTTEGQGLAIMEALIAGKPVVGTDVAGIQDVINGGRFGLLSGKDAVSSPDSLANTLSLAIASEKYIQYVESVEKPLAISYITLTAKGQWVVDSDNWQNADVVYDSGDDGQLAIEIKHPEKYPNRAVFVNGLRVEATQPNGARYQVQNGSAIMVVLDLKQQVCFEQFNWRKYNQDTLNEFETRAII